MFEHHNRVSKFRIELDSPPGKVFSGEDTLSGRVVLDSHSDENVGFVLIIFRGTVHLKVRTGGGGTGYSGGGSNSTIWEDYISLFEHVEVLYRGHFKLRRDVPYQWPFSFDFGYQNDGSSWPPSGVYDSPNTKKVGYEAMAMFGPPNQDPERLLNMVSHASHGPDFRGAPFQPSTLFVKLGEHLHHVAEIKLPFMPLRTAQMEADLPGCINTRTHQHQIPVPKPATNDAPQKHSLFHHREELHGNFSIDFITPDTYILGSSIPCHIDINWECQEMAPFPPARLVSFKFSMWKITQATALQRHHEELVQTVVLFEAKSCDLVVNVGRLDLGRLFNIVLEENIEPSFSCPGLTRSYTLLVDLNFRIAEKKIPGYFLIHNTKILPKIPVQSEGMPPAAALNQKPQKGDLQPYASMSPVAVLLDQSHTCRLRFDKGQAIREDSLNEAAVILSKMFSKRNVAHSFPDGSCIELHAPRKEARASSGYDDYHDDRQRIISMFDSNNRFSLVESKLENGLTFNFLDPLHGASIKVEVSISFPSGPSSFSGERPKSHHAKIMAKYHLSLSEEHEISLNPVSLLNHRLRIAAAGDGTYHIDPEDFTYLVHRFQTYLHKNKADIDENAVRAALYERRDWEPLSQALEQLGFDTVTDAGYGHEYGRHVRRNDGSARVGPLRYDDQVGSKQRTLEDQRADERIHGKKETSSDMAGPSRGTFNLETLDINDEDDRGGEAPPAYGEVAGQWRTC